MKRFLCGWLLLVMSTLQAALPPATVKKRMQADLDFIKSVFEVSYAPLMWKESYSGWDLEEEIAVAKAKVEALRNPSMGEFRRILRDFFNSTRDYHVGVRFFSTERSELPFLLKGAEGRHFVAHVERGSRCPLELGDEVLLFGGRPVGEVIEELRLKQFGTNTLETDRALAELGLTVRDGEMGDEIQSGSVKIQFRKKKSGKIETCTLQWNHIPEKIKEFSRLGASCALQTHASLERKDSMRLIQESDFFNRMFVAARWDKPPMLEAENVHVVGGRRSYIPPLGRKIWNAGGSYPFDAYIFEDSMERRIGYVRIPHYHGDEEEVLAFSQLVEVFEKHCEALVIDQINNPGGSLFYLYGLASLLTDRPLDAPKHHLVLTQKEVDMALTILPLLDNVQDARGAQQVLGETFAGYPVDYETVTLMRSFCKFLIAEWEAGHLYTGPTHMFGVDKIRPHPRVHFSKPILFLTNSLDFSGGDFFPAILQDSKRALILGTRTAGAGGYVFGVRFPNTSGMSGFRLTGSLAERANQTPIENLGVMPDVLYEHTVRDLQEGYPDYTAAILHGVDLILQK